MKISSIGIITGMAGKLDKSEKLVFSNRYGNIHAWNVTPSDKEPSAAQLAQQAKFASVNSQVKTEMADPVKKAQWEAVAKASKGKWKTARGACFASLMKSQIENEG